LEVDVIIGSVHQSDSEVPGKNYIHDVDLLNDNTIWIEFGLEVLHHLGGKLRFNISHSRNLDLFDKVTNLLFALFLEKLL